METKPFYCDLVTNIYPNISYEQLKTQINENENIMRIGTDYYFRQGFKGKLGCVLYRGFAIEPFE